MKNEKLSNQRLLDIDAVFLGVFVCDCLNLCNLSFVSLRSEEVAETLLSLEVCIDRDTLDLLLGDKLAVFDLIVDPETALDCHSSNLHSLCAVESPSGTAWCVNLDVAWSRSVHCLLDLLHEVHRVCHGCGCNVRGTVCD